MTRASIGVTAMSLAAAAHMAAFSGVPATPRATVAQDRVGVPPPTTVQSNASAKDIGQLREQAKRDVLAQFERGLRFFEGHGVKQDYQEAFKWFRRAADKGLAEAEFNLGVMFLQGNGREKEPSEAAKWIRKAADHGLPQAEFSLSGLFDSGVGVPRNHTSAVEIKVRHTRREAREDPAPPDRGVIADDLKRSGAGTPSPRLVREFKPQYTQAAMQAKVQGSVLVEGVVLKDGSISELAVIRSLDWRFGLDREALKAAARWVFAPATSRGMPVNAVVSIDLAFSLK